MFLEVLGQGSHLSGEHRAGVSAAGEDEVGDPDLAEKIGASDGLTELIDHLKIGNGVWLGFHAVMNLFLMPLWFLSGALFPVESAPNWLAALMKINPVTYGVSALRHGFYYGLSESATTFSSPITSLTVNILFGALTFSLAVWLVRRSAGRVW